jgi:hypothetical protein
MISQEEIVSLIAVCCKAAMICGVSFQLLFLDFYNSKTRVLPFLLFMLFPAMFGSLLHFLHQFEPFGDYVFFALSAGAVWLLLCMLLKFSYHVAITHFIGVVFSGGLFALGAYHYDSNHGFGLGLLVMGLIVLGVLVCQTLMSRYEYSLFAVLAYFAVVVLGATMIVLLFYGPAVYDQISELSYLLVFEVVQVLDMALLCFLAWFGYTPATTDKQNSTVRGTPDFMDALEYTLLFDKFAPAQQKSKKKKSAVSF